MCKHLLNFALPSSLVLVFGCTLVMPPLFAQIKLDNEDISIRFGVQGQLWANWAQDNTGARGYQQNFYLRRARAIVAGDLLNDVSFFFETDSPNLGKSPKSPSAGFMLQDLFLEWKPSKVLQIDGGLFLVPFSRNSLQSALSYYTVDLSPLTTVNNSATQSAALRDLGFQARGFFLKDRLLYRVGAFQGQRDANGRNSMRTAGYVQYDFFHPETGYTLIGTALGKQKILAIDAGADTQGSYRGLSTNIACDLPVHGGDEIGGQYQFFHYDGRKKFSAIQDQNDWFIEGAYYLHRVKMQPFFKFETQRFVEAANAAKDVNRLGTGINYYIHNQNLKWTVQYNRALPRNRSSLAPANEFTMQLQVYYF